MAKNFTAFDEGVRLRPRGTEPSDPLAGDLYFDDTLNVFRGYNGTEWVSFDVASLQQAYEASVSPQITLDATLAGLRIADATVAIGTDLFKVTNNAGSVSYLNVTADGIESTRATIDNVRVDGNTLSTISGDLQITPTGETNSTKRLNQSGELSLTNKLLVNTLVDSATTGADATLPTPTRPHVATTNASLTSIQNITFVEGQQFVYTNATGGEVVLRNGTGNIITGTGSDLTVANNASVLLVGSTPFAGWLVVGGSGGGGGGGTSEYTGVGGEDLAINDYVYISTGTGADTGRTAGRIYRTENDVDERIEGIGFVTAASLTGDPVVVTLLGPVDGFTGLTPGAPVYMGAAPGAYTQTAPTATGSWSVQIGVAVSATELLVNPMAGSNAIYIAGAGEVAFSAANNVSSPTNITGLIYDGGAVRSVQVDYSIYRHHTSNSEASQCGTLILTYSTVAGTWDISDEFAGSDCGATFSITALGQVQYVSDNRAGTLAEFSMKFKERVAFGV